MFFTQAVSESGGFCEDKVDQKKYHHVTDTKLITALASFFAGKSVGSFGDGRGYYKAALDKTKQLKLYDGMYKFLVFYYIIISCSR